MNLDELISHKAVEFADQIRAAAAMADKEEEIRIEAEKQLAFIQKEAGIKLEGKHEFTVASGRVDSVYDRVIIEYKNPASPAARIGLRADSGGGKKVVEQIKKRFYDLRNQFNQPLNSLLGVGLDGNHFIFVRFRDEKWQVQEPVEVNRHTAERFLWALFNLGQKGKPFSPAYLAGDFGSDAKLAQEGIRALYDAIVHTDNPKAQIFFNQWRILFGEVCGYDVDNPSDKIKKLASFYAVPVSGLKPAEMLFAVHSYYAIFMKLLASEIVAFFHKLPTPLRKMQQATTSNKLKREMEDLEAGSIFRHLNISNFLEGDLFAWYTSVWNEPIEKLVRQMVAKLDDYNPGTLSEDPAGSRDLLKKLYQQLFPKSVRHDLGEYYTPDWLAEHTLNELEYAGDPDKRLLDPACGSGTFLVMAINRIRKWFEENREMCGFDEGEVCRKILSNVIGFDLNPLAVMAARTNYLIAVRDLIGHVDKVELPVYLCDSIMTPSEYGGLFAGSLGKAKELKTAAANFIIPTEIAEKREDIAKYAEQLEHCVKNGYTPDEFLERCQDEALPVSEAMLHTDLYKELVKLDKANKNGVWARIIKNAFAPIFIGRVDYIVGNPPWVNWESLPADYRQDTLELWDKYNLRQRANSGTRLGNVKKELSALFVYVAMDHYATDNGLLGFVITQAIFKTGANEGFRRFSQGAKKQFCIESVSDLSLFLPFENAVNRTAILIARNGKNNKYPVAYRFWVPQTLRTTVADEELDFVLDKFNVQDWLAAPVELSVKESPWLTAPKEAYLAIKKIIGDRSTKTMTRSYAGTCTWLNGAYWVEQIDSGMRRPLIRNLGDVGKKKLESVTVAVEDDYLFPLLRGRDVQAWQAKPSAFILVPHRMDNFAEPVSVEELKRKNPLLFEYFKQFEKPLRERSGYKQLHKSRKEFYVMGNVGDYVLLPYKVVFKDLSNVFQCAVVEPMPYKNGETRTVIPDHTLLFITCRSKDESYFLSGVLNSIPVRIALYSASSGVQTQRYFPTDISRVQLPELEFNNRDHVEVIRLSKTCHEIMSQGNDHNNLAETEAELSEVVGSVLGLSSKELKYLKSYYNQIQHFRKREILTDNESIESE